MKGSYSLNVISEKYYLYPPSKTNVVCPCQNCSGSLEKFCKKTGEKPREKDQFGDTEQTPSLLTGEFYLAGLRPISASGEKPNQ